MKGQEKLVQETLSQPDEIRRSRSDPNVYLFYKLQRPKRWLCAIIRKRLAIALQNISAKKPATKLF